MKLSLLSITFAILAIASAQAEDQPKDTLEFKSPIEVIVTAPRMSIPLKEAPFSASLVEKSTLQSQPRAVSIEEALRLVPGVKVDNQSNGRRVHMSIRGQGILTERGIRGIKILEDGIPANDPTGFAPDFFDLDLGTIDHIEVFRGAAASLYGSGGAGGIVSIVTENAPPEPSFGDFTSEYGSNNFWKTLGQFGGQVGNVNYRLSASRMMGDGYREHTHFWGDNVYGKAIYAPTPSVVLTPIFGWTKAYHENPEGIDLATYNENPKLANPDAIPYNEFLQTERVTHGLTGSVKIDDRQNVQFLGFLKRTLFTEANNHTFNHRNILTPGTSVEYSFSAGKDEDKVTNRINVGTDLQWQTIEEYRVDNLLAMEGDTIRSREKITQRGTGFFVIDKVSINKRWGAMLSMRYDKITNELTDQLKAPYDASGSADFDKTTFRVGGTYSPNDKVDLFANWGQGFLPPATEELAQNPDNFGGFNEHLTSATSSGVDLGCRGTLRPGFYYDITGFYLHTNNDFDRYRITDPLRNQETFYRNAGASRRFGIEFYSRYAPVEKVKLQVAYTYSHFKYSLNDSIQVLMEDPAVVKFIRDGNWLPNSPQHQLALDFEYSPLPKFALGLSTETMSKSFIDGANIEAEAVSGYTLIGARARYDLHLAGLNLELSVQGRNLGDKKYIAFSEPDPGGNAYQPGAGREFFGAVKMKL